MAPQSVSAAWRFGSAGRAAMIGLVAVAALAFAGRSLAAVTPHLVVSSTVAGSTQTLRITASKQQADDTVARVQFYVPTGFLLDSPAVGVKVGTATAKVVMRDVNATTEQALKGTVTAISPAEPAIAYEGSNCDTSQHLAAWMVQLGGSKAGYSFPIYVDASGGPAASFGSYVLVACFRSPDLASSDPNRSPSGTVVDSFALALKPFARPTTAGAYRWRSLWTPFTAGTDTLNQAGNVEAQSIVDIPTGQIVIFGKKMTQSVHGTTRIQVMISGQVLVDSEPQGPELVTIRHGVVKTKLVSLGGVRTGTDGGYTKFATLLAPKEYFQASATLAAKDLGAAGCQPSFPNVACVDATSGAGRVVSGLMLVGR